MFRIRNRMVIDYNVNKVILFQGVLTCTLPVSDYDKPARRSV